MRIQDVQADVAFGKKIAEQGAVILNLNKAIEDFQDENKALKNQVAAQAGLLKDAQEKNRALEDKLASLSKAVPPAPCAMRHAESPLETPEEATL